MNTSDSVPRLIPVYSCVPRRRRRTAQKRFRRGYSESGSVTQKARACSSLTGLHSLAFARGIQSRVRAAPFALMSWHLPAQPLRRRVLIPFAMLTLATVQVATLVSPHLGATPAFPVKAALAFGGAASIAAGYVADTHPFARLGAANVVTALRLLLTSLVAGLIGEPPNPSVAAFAAAVALVVTSMDGVDGWLARRFGTASAFGARFDMETDALLILVLALLAWLHGKAGVWIVLAGAMRYLFVAASYRWPWMDAPASAEHPAQGGVRPADRRTRCRGVATRVAPCERRRGGRDAGGADLVLWSRRALVTAASCLM